VKAKITMLDEKGFKKMLKRLPQQTVNAAARTLSDMAYTSRMHGLTVLNRVMTIRNPSFIRAALQYSPVDRISSVMNPQSFTNITRLKSAYGSVQRNRFSGWIEQETGQKTEFERTPTFAARTMKWDKQIEKRLRMTRSAKIKHLSDFPGATRKEQMGLMMAFLYKQKKEQLIWLSKPYGRMRDGLWLFNNPRMSKHHISGIQQRERTFTLIYAKKPLQPRQLHWMQQTNDTVKLNPQAIFETYMDKFLG